MSWTLFAQLFVLIILIYLCIRALINARSEAEVLKESALMNERRKDDAMRKIMPAPQDK